MLGLDRKNFRNLLADATLCYLEALKKKEILQINFLSFKNMASLAHADSLRHLLGEINEVDAIRSRLETTSMMNNYLQSKSEYENILSDLIVYEGGYMKIDSIAGNLPNISLKFNLDTLIVKAQENRTDLQAALHSKNLSSANLRLAKANRMIDLGLNIGFGHNTVVLNEIAPAPKFNSISAGVTIPLKFSSANKGELNAAQFNQEQTNAQFENIMIQIKKEVKQCYNNYVMFCQSSDLYKNSTLNDAIKILDKKKYSYQQGQTSLLEVLDAQNTLNDVYQTYYETLFNRAASLVHLYRAVGIWDMTL